MPLIYADSSVLFAYFHPKDNLALAVTEAARGAGVDFIYWEWLRFEVRHNLRQARVDRWGETAWNALRAAEKTSSRLRWQGDVHLSSILESADELSEEKKPECGSADVLHVAAARRISLLSSLDEFWTGDQTQAALARQCGIKTRLLNSK